MLKLWDSRALLCGLLVATMGSVGCASVTKTVGWTLVGTGGLMAGTGFVLAAGCTKTDSVDPNNETRGPCMPDATWEKAGPAVVTGLVTGIIILAAGVAVLATEGELKPGTTTPDPNTTTTPTKAPESSCTGGDICY